MSQRHQWNISVPPDLYLQMEAYLKTYKNETLSKVVRNAVSIYLDSDAVDADKAPPVASREQ